ncbi:MAG: ABC transporter ATP-binding protein [Dehalococcoidales bacterium]
MENNILVDVKNLYKYFPITRGIIIQHKIADIKAVDNVSFFIRRGETLGLVGESGSGKTTIGKCILQLYDITHGEILFDGVDLCHIPPNQLRAIRPKLQPIFQDPYSSLNPRQSVESIVGEPLTVNGLAKGKKLKDRVAELLTLVELDPEMAERYPHMFSGGQRQRIGIARALATNPTFIVCDEPVSALDVSIQAQIVNLLDNLQDSMDLTMLFISHDLSLVRHISDRIAVMYLGKLVELAASNDLYNNPLHPYTQALISAVPIPDPAIERNRKRLLLPGEIPSPLNPPSGCRFHPRCPEQMDICSKEVPKYKEINSHWVACHLH